MSADPREETWAHFPNDAREILNVRRTHCRAPKCHAPVWLGYTAARGKVTVFDIKPDGTYTGTNHWRTCLDRERFKR